MSHYCTADELEQLSAARENIYAFTGQAFSKEADERLWQAVEDIAAAHTESNSDASGGFARLARYAVRCEDAPLTELAVDYAATFLGIGPRHDGAFPYESVYTSDEKLLKQEAFDEMNAVLRSKRIALAIDMVSDEDHVSTELALLARYAHDVRRLLGEGDTDGAWSVESERIGFLLGHAMRWIPDFCADVKRYAKTDFYRAIADIASDFLMLDASIVEGEPQATMSKAGAA